MNVKIPRSILSRVLMAAAMSATLPAHAQSEDGPSIAEELADGSRLRTSLETGISYTSNFFYADSAGDEQDATGLLVRPAAMVSHVVPRFRFYGGGKAELAWFDLQDDVDDYTDYELNLGSQWTPASRHVFSFAAEYRDDHDPFGTERTEGTPLEGREIDKWRQTHTNVGYRYGLPSDRYNVELRASGLNKTYHNNRGVTQYLDHEIASAQLFAYYNVGAKTSLYALLAGQHSYYEETAPGAFDRGADTTRYMLGTRWLASAKTSGDIRAGYVVRDPAAGERSAYRRFDWQARLTWAPRAVREFRLTTGRQPQESFLNTVDFIDHRYVGVAWNEQWTPRLQTEVRGRYVESAFVGSARVDETVYYALSTEFGLSRDLKLLGLVGNDRRDSDAVFAEYDRFYAYLGARYTH